MWNPFTIDDDGDRMDLSGALLKVQDELNQFDMENEMAIKKPAKKADAEETKVKKKTAETNKKDTAKTTTKAKGTRATPEGYVGLTELAKEMNMDPAAIRRKLRSLGTAKPEGQHGWFWKDGSKDLSAIKKALSAS